MTCVGVRDPVGEQAVAVRRAANRTIVNQEGSETHRGGGTAKERRVRERRERQTQRETGRQRYTPGHGGREAGRGRMGRDPRRGGNGHRGRNRW